MKLIIDLLFGLIFTTSLAGLGSSITRRLFRTNTDFFTSVFIGAAMALLPLYLLGTIGGLNSVVALLWMASIFLFVIRGRRKLARWRLENETICRIPSIISILLFLVVAVISLSPPIKNDTLFYHLGLPKLWFAERAIRFFPTIPLSASALNAELFLVPIVGVVSAEAAQFQVMLFGLCTAFLLAGAAQRFGGVKGLVVVPMLASVPAYMTVLPDAKNDILAIGFVATAAVFYFEFIRSQKKDMLMLAGIIAGMAAGTKPNCLFFVLALAVVVIFSHPRPRHALPFLAVLVVFASFWYVRAWSITGNPLFPFFDNVFHSPYWRAEFDVFSKATAPLSETKNIGHFLTSIFRLVYLPDIFRARVGPLPWVLLPLLLLHRNIPRPITKTLVIALIFFVFWYVVWANGRYLLPAVVLLLFPGALALAFLVRRYRLSALVTAMAMSLILVANGAQILRDGWKRILATVGAVERKEFLREISLPDPNQPLKAERVLALPYYPVWEYANASLPETARVAILCSNWFRADGFYLDRSFYYLNPTEQVIFDFTAPVGQINAALVANKVTHALIDLRVEEEFSFATLGKVAPGFEKFSRGVTEFCRFIRDSGKLLYRHGDFELFELANSALLQ